MTDQHAAPWQNPATVAPRVLDGLLRCVSRGDREPKGAAHGSAKRLPPKRVRAPASDDDAACAAGFCDPDDCSEVAWILDVHRDDDERGGAGRSRVDRGLLGDRHDGAGSDGAEGAHHQRRRHGDIESCARASTSASTSSRVGADGGAASEGPGREGVSDQMRAVEQQTPPPRPARPRESAPRAGSVGW